MSAGRPDRLSCLDRTPHAPACAAWAHTPAHTPAEGEMDR